MAKHTFGALVVAAIFGFLGGLAGQRSSAPALAQGSDVVTAREFRVIDGANRLRGVLSTKNPNGWVQLDLKSSDGLSRVTLNVNQEGGAFVLLYDKANKGVYSTNFRMPSINLIGPAGEIKNRLQ